MHLPCRHAKRLNRMPGLINDTPWDTAAFGLHTGEISQYSAEALQLALQTPGHYTIKVDPLVSKQLLHDYGFYYCDTLIEPYCSVGKLNVLSHPEISISKNVSWEELLPICHGAFRYGRFHRDFNLANADADRRYDNWLHQLYQQHSVYGLLWHDQLAGFIACSANSLVLHAVAKDFQGKKMAKYWWSAVCTDLFNSGSTEVTSSISAANMAAMNLYASLGFRFRSPLDVYHRLVK